MIMSNAKEKKIIDSIPDSSNGEQVSRFRFKSFLISMVFTFLLVFGGYILFLWLFLRR